jgi:NADH-quinone oxidoreductase subunit L
LAPPVQFAVAVIGAATLLMAGFSALSQTDIKRVLAWSTISQIGYMFLALGVGAWSAAIFHFMTHAFFKALLFLAAGIVIEALHHEQNIFNMGGLRKELPVAFWSFLIGGSALAGLPLITSGYWSKDLIVWSAWSAAGGSTGFWIAGLAGVFLTSLYTYRLIFIVFFGSVRTPVTHRPGLAMSVPVLILCALSSLGGYVRGPFIAFLTTVLPATTERHATLSEALSGLAAAVMFAGGALLAYKPPRLPAVGDWGFDWLYDRLFVRPILWFARINRRDFVDVIVNAMAAGAAACNRLLSYTETGHLRWYAAGIAFGSVLLVALVLLS